MAHMMMLIDGKHGCGELGRRPNINGQLGNKRLHLTKKTN